MLICLSDISPFLLDLTLFFGHFHPLLVHLPIGFLVLALLLECAGILEKQAAIRAAVPFVLLVGTLSAVLACITGWTLSTTGGYDLQALNLHKWTALTIPFLSLFAWLVSTKKIKSPVLQSRRSLLWTLTGLTGILMVAGHAGATLTHGAGYLSAGTLFDGGKKKHTVSSLKDALVFEDIVQPILDRKCGSCHNGAKQKGGLSLENLNALLKGGKHGPIIVPGRPTASEMIKRVSLDPGDKKFMPSDGKPPLSAEEAALLKWWIGRNMGNTDAKWTELATASDIPAEVKKYVETSFNALSPGSPSSGSLSSGNLSGKGLSDSARMAVPKVPPVSQEKLLKLQQAGFVVRLIDREPILLDVTLPPPVKTKETTSQAPAPDKTGSPARASDLSKPVDPAILNALLAVKENIIWLNLSGNNISDEQMDIVNQCKNIRILKLQKTPLSDKGIARLNALGQMQSINLYNTRVTRNCLAGLSKMKNLATVYVWGTAIKKDAIPASDSPHLSIVGGNDPGL
ncbi:MAG: hypothetical protein P4L51_16710 [Puia sp.]|nr:hypothetical protein [Puia sp.]